MICLLELCYNVQSTNQLIYLINIVEFVQTILLYKNKTLIFILLITIIVFRCSYVDCHCILYNSLINIYIYIYIAYHTSYKKLLKNCEII